jgi:DDE superfamily endonuclease
MNSDEEEDSDQRLLALLLWWRTRRRSKAKNEFRMQLTAAERRMRNRNLPRNALLDPEKSPWSRVYESKDDPALITVTGFDHNAFAILLGLFEPLFNGYSPWTGSSEDGYKYRRAGNETRGRKRKTNRASCLGLVLAWFRFRGSEFILQGWFGFTGAHLNVWLRFGRRMLLKLLRDHADAIVKFPDDERVKAYQHSIHARHRHLPDVYCVCDGLKLPFQKCDQLNEQSRFYNGWKAGHYITNLFVFGADGRIINAVTNVPGSVHDSTLAVWGGTYRKLKEVYERTGGVCCVDSAFASGGVPYLLKSAKKEQVHKIAKSKEDMARILDATSLRQAAEWGMRAIQGSMPRLKDKIRFELKGERKVIMKLVPLIYNIRLSLVGLNQLKSTYVKNWERDSRMYIRGNVDSA